MIQLYQTEAPITLTSPDHTRILLLPVTVPNGGEMHLPTIATKWERIRDLLSTAPTHRQPVFYPGRTRWVKVEETTIVAMLPVTRGGQMSIPHLLICLTEIAPQAVSLQASVHFEPFGDWCVLRHIFHGAFYETGVPVFVHQRRQDAIRQVNDPVQQLPVQV